MGLTACSSSGTLNLTMVDQVSGRPVPARLELVDADGDTQIPEGALALNLECLRPPPTWWDWGATDHLTNPTTGTDQFYLAGSTTTDLPSGTYRLRGFRGPEYHVAETSFEIAAGETTDASLAFERWTNMPATGWFSADDHIHIRRETADDDRRIGAWMHAEDLHVANLLEMGTARGMPVTRQHHYGDDGVHETEGHLLVSGQEHPRTHFLGHTIALGADQRVDVLDTYIDYETTFRPARAAGAATGFAHYGHGPARDGLAVTAPQDLVDFIEVLQFEHLATDAWYDMLNLGLRIAPTAGTDFPCGPFSVPGRERFYTKVEGPLTRTSWLEGVRSGRTFVTNGPMLDLSIDGAGPGDELALSEDRPIEIRGSVWFDPARDRVQRLELVRNGRVIATEAVDGATDRIVLRTTVRPEAPAWYALRATGEKVGELPRAPFPVPEFALEFFANFASGADLRERERVARTGGVRPSVAHSAAVWVNVDGASPHVDGDATQRELERLDALERRLSDDEIDDQTIWDFIPYSDGVSLEHLRNNRAALLAAIERARTFHRTRTAIK